MAGIIRLPLSSPSRFLRVRGDTSFVFAPLLSLLTTSPLSLFPALVVPIVRQIELSSDAKSAFLLRFQVCRRSSCDLHPRSRRSGKRRSIPFLGFSLSLGVRNGRPQQRRAAVPRDAGVEALRRPLRQHRLAGALLLRARSRRARLRPRPDGAPDDARGRRPWRCLVWRLLLGGLAQCVHEWRFQHPGWVSEPSLITFYFYCRSKENLGHVKGGLISKRKMKRTGSSNMYKFTETLIAFGFPIRFTANTRLCGIFVDRFVLQN